MFKDLSSNTHLCGGHRWAVLSILYFIMLCCVGTVVVDYSDVDGCCFVLKKLKRPPSRCPCQVHRKCIFVQLFKVSQILILSTEFAQLSFKKRKNIFQKYLPSYRNKIHRCRSKLLIYRGDNSCTRKPHN